MFYHILITTFLLAILANVNSQQIHGLAGRIIGGEATTIRSVPYQCSLWNGTHQFCGAALLYDEWIITAAHCMGKMGDYQVRINSTISNGGGTLLDVVANYTHPEFDELYSYDYDVALIKVNKIDSTGLRLAKFPKCDAEKCNVPGNYINASGWGVNNITDPLKSIILQTVRLPIVELEKCKEIYTDDSPVTDRMFCAGYLEKGGKDSCQGDSGGPAICQGNLVGVVSFGYECAKAGEPAMYTDLLEPTIQEWIANTTGVHRNCKKKRPRPIGIAKQKHLERE